MKAKDAKRRGKAWVSAKSTMYRIGSEEENETRQWTTRRITRFRRWRLRSTKVGRKAVKVGGTLTMDVVLDRSTTLLRRSTSSVDSVSSSSSLTRRRDDAELRRRTNEIVLVVVVVVVVVVVFFSSSALFRTTSSPVRSRRRHPPRQPDGTRRSEGRTATIRKVATSNRRRLAAATTRRTGRQEPRNLRWSSRRTSGYASMPTLLPVKTKALAAPRRLSKATTKIDRAGVPTNAAPRPTQTTKDATKAVVV
mmetsp:Transcript_9931/g.30121  ORF Transcript_9931/g.30121 Transcript_9931/m.30121 type:complete len:251 (-) Transcript_9931:351-1103(-)